MYFPGGHRRYPESAFIKTVSMDKERVLYARVSTKTQLLDLDTQIDFLGKTYPGCRVVKDVASSMNWKRNALKQVSTRVGCTVVSVNCAYTSQLDSRFSTLTGSRNGDKFTGHDGVVMHSDTNAADNVLARMSDVEITRYMKHSDVKVILLERTQKFHRFPNSGN